MKSFYLLENSIQTYAWGSLDGIPEITGMKNIARQPMAEMWMGAHPGSPSKITVDGGSQPLDRFIADNPQECVGRASFRRFGPTLPFLFKILSIDSPLSLQVHPSAEQATAGFSRETALGIPLSSPQRNYKDDNHKSEIILALTPLTTICGFRDPAETVSLLTLFNIPLLDRIIADLRTTGNYRVLCSYLLELPQHQIVTLLEDMKEKAAVLARSGPTLTRQACTLFLELTEFYPTDIGTLAPLYLHILILQPGDAVYLPTGILHTYIKGTGIELMSNSDNVLRGGLTSKHIDIPEFLSIVNPSTFYPGIIHPNTSSGLFRYLTESEDFELSTISLDSGAIDLPADYPAIIIVISGNLTLSDALRETILLPKGKTVFIPASGRMLTISGKGTGCLASLPAREQNEQ